MKVLVTGATGFVGGALARRLAAEGHVVHALVRSPEKAAGLVGQGIVAFRGDILDPASLAAAAAGCDAACHAAALATARATSAEYFRANVDGALNVLRAAAAAGVRRTVVTSSAGVFGPSAGAAPIDETHRRTVPFFNDYEASKAKLHEAVGGLVREGADIVIVCPTRIYGPGPLAEANSVTRIVDLYRRGRWRLLPGDGSAIGNYVHVDDVVAGHIAAMEQGRAGEAYILGGENASYRAFFDAIGKATGRPRRLAPVPAGLLLSFARLDKWRAAKLGGRPVLTPAWVRRYLADWAQSSAKAGHELGYRPRSLAEGIVETVAWLENRRA